MRDYAYAIGRISEEMSGVVRKAQDRFEEMDALPRWRVLRRRRCENEAARWLLLLDDLQVQRAGLTELAERAQSVSSAAADEKRNS